MLGRGHNKLSTIFASAMIGGVFAESVHMNMKPVAMRETYNDKYASIVSQ